MASPLCHSVQPSASFGIAQESHLRPNPSLQGTAGKLRLPVPCGLRPPAAPELKR
jgi:hypothetical protein